MRHYRTSLLEFGVKENSIYSPISKEDPSGHCICIADIPNKGEKLMAYDLTDASVDKRLKDLKEPLEPREEIPLHIIRTAGFLCRKIAARPKRPRRNGGFRPKSERQNQTNHS